MKNCVKGKYESIEEALKRLGLKVEKISREGKKTIITVFQADTGKKIPISSKKQRTSSKNEVFDG